MEIKFILPTGKIVASPNRFGQYETLENKAFYSRIKILELNKNLINEIEKIREDLDINPQFLHKDFFEPLIQEIEIDQNVLKKVNYHNELRNTLLKKYDIDINNIQNRLKKAFPEIYFYKNFEENIHQLALVELTLFNVARVIPGKPIIKYSREVKDKKPAITLYLDKYVTKKTWELYYDNLINPFFNIVKSNLESIDTFKISDEALEIIRLSLHENKNSSEIAKHLGKNEPTGSSIRGTLREYRNLSKV